MADNIPITAGTGTAVATDDIGGVHYQINKIGYGVLDSLTLVSTTNGLPVQGAFSARSPASGTLSASDAVVAAPIGDGTLVSGASTAGSVVFAAVPDGAQTWILLIKGYVSGTIYTEASFNSTNGTDGDWVEVKGRRTGTAPGTESVVYAMVANGYYRGNCSGFTYVRARLIGGTGPTIAWSLSTALGPTFLNSGIPSGSSVIGAVTQSGTWNVGTVTTLPSLVAGAAVIGAVTQSGTWNVGTITTLPALATGANVIGAVTQSGTWNIGTVTTLPALVAGAALIGKVGIDQTTPGTTNLVSIGTSGTVAINAALPIGANVIGALSANQSVNVTQMGGVAVTMGSGVTGTGVQRVVLATDVALPTGANVIGALTANQSVNNAQVNGVTPLMGNGVTGTGSQRVTIASDNSAVPTSATAGEYARLPAVSTSILLSAVASTNATSVKGSAGAVKGIQGYNAKTSPVYLKLYNKATAPTVGTDTPIKTIYLPASTGFLIDFPAGYTFATGIAYALTLAAANADTTALIAGDVICLNVDYI